LINEIASDSTLLESCGVERPDYRAVGADALAHFETQIALDQRRIARIAQVERFGAVAAADFEHVPVALGGDECGLRADALDEGVDDERCAELHQFRMREIDPRLAQALHHPVDQVPIGREALGIEEAPGAAIQGREVGECAAGIGGDDEASVSLFGF